MKIVIDARWVRNQKIDGIGRYLLEVAHNLIAQSSDHEFIFLFKSEENKKFFEAQIGIPIKAKILSFDILTPKDIILLPRALRALNTDVFFSPNYLTTPFHRGYQTVLVVHDFIPYFFKYARASKLWRVYYRFKFQTRLILTRANKIIAVSESTARDIKALFNISQNKIAIIHEGIDPRFKILPREEVAQVLASHQLPRDYIIYVGRQDPYKNIAGLISAYNFLPPALKQNHPLVIVGRKNDRYFPDLEKLVAKLNLKNQVYFIDYLTDSELVAVYNGAKVATLVTFYEGFGFPILEAQACGIPLICSNISSHPGVAGKAAILVNPYDIGEITNALNLLLTNPEKARQLVAQGLENIKNFSWGNTAQKTLEVIEATKKP